MVISPPTDSTKDMPECFNVAVVMERSPSSSTWTDDRWRALGVTVTPHTTARLQSEVRKIYEAEGGVQHYLYPDYSLRLHADECESYYHNLISPEPRCFVVADPDQHGVPVPFLVSLSFDEANAYLEGEELVYSVDLPPELYRWCERFVIDHYVPTLKTKRKLNDWKAGPARPKPPAP